jgi:hypothetical protein
MLGGPLKLRLRGENLCHRPQIAEEEASSPLKPKAGLNGPPSHVQSLNAGLVDYNQGIVLVVLPVVASQSTFLATNRIPRTGRTGILRP